MEFLEYIYLFVERALHVHTTTSAQQIIYNNAITINISV